MHSQKKHIRYSIINEPFAGRYRAYAAVIDVDPPSTATMYVFEAPSAMNRIAHAPGPSIMVVDADGKVIHSEFRFYTRKGEAKKISVDIEKVTVEPQ